LEIGEVVLPKSFLLIPAGISTASEINFSGRSPFSLGPKPSMTTVASVLPAI